MATSAVASASSQAQPIRTGPARADEEDGASAKPPPLPPRVALPLLPLPRSAVKSVLEEAVSRMDTVFLAKRAASSAGPCVIFDTYVLERMCVCSHVSELHPMPDPYSAFLAHPQMGLRRPGGLLQPLPSLPYAVRGFSILHTLPYGAHTITHTHLAPLLTYSPLLSLAHSQQRDLCGPHGPAEGQGVYRKGPP